MKQLKQWIRIGFGISVGIQLGKNFMDLYQEALDYVSEKLCKKGMELLKKASYEFKNDI